ncbi:MAG: hypothetical protein AAFP22_09275, partial [Planctomycetota bacterium]
MQEGPLPAQIAPSTAASFGALAAAALSGLLIAGCSSSDSAPFDTSVGALVQDLVEDPTGRIVVAPLVGPVEQIVPTNVQASGGQSALSVWSADGELVMTFDERVTPSHQVRIVGVDGVDEAWRGVATSDPRQTRVSILEATQDVSDATLGGDTIRVAFFSGPRVIESEIEDISNWSLFVEGVELDLTGSTVSLDPPTQTAQIDLGAFANLHATFEIAVQASTVADVTLSTSPVLGAAVGDTAPPALEGAQPIAQLIDVGAGGSEFGDLVVVDFDEPMSPVFGASIANFGVVDHPQAVATTSVTRAVLDPADPSRVFLQFSGPVVPGYDQLGLTGVRDAHGNALPAITAPVAAATLAANAYSSVDFTTVEGIGNDLVVFELDQPIDPDFAGEAGAWSLEVDSAVIDPAQYVVGYDFAARRVTFALDFDVPNGAQAQVFANNVVDVDGEDFTLTSALTAATGDVVAPSVESVTQNRDADDTGFIVDVAFSEDLDVTSATNTAEYVFDPVNAIVSASVIDGTIVRLVTTDPVVPGDFQLDVGTGVADPAGNTPALAQDDLTVGSTDTEAPVLQWTLTRIVEGAANDLVYVGMNDRMIEAEIVDPANWSIQSPIGTALDLTGSTVTYDPITSIASLTLDGASPASFRIGDSVSVALSGVRDVAGNGVDTASVTSEADGERNLPSFDTAFVQTAQPTVVVARFSEPMGRLDDLFDASTNPEGVRVTVVDAVTSDASAPVSAAPTADLLGMELTFASSVPVGSALTIVGLTDLAGNPLFPVDGFALEAETGTPLGFDASTEARALQGARNDTITLEFMAPLGPWDVLDRSRLSMIESPSGDPIDLSTSTLEQTSPTTLVVTLTSGAVDQLESGATYQVTLTSDPSSPIASRQGVELVGSTQTSALAVVGDVSQGPTAASFAVVDALDAREVVVVFDEAVFPAAAAVAAEYSIGAATPTAATLVGDRAVRLTFASPVTVGSFVDVTTVAAVDASQNAASGTLSLAVQADVDAPAITGATADIVPGAALDLVTVTFDEPLDPTLARSPSSYTISSVGGGSVAFVAYDEETLTTTFGMVGLIQGETLGIQVDAASDLAGNALAAPISTTATVDGDDVPPAIVSGMVDLFSDPTGRTVLILFSEPVRPVFVTSPSAWSSTGAENVQGLELVAPDRLLMQLDGALAPTSV